MKKMIALGIGASMLFLGGCVENSAKYRRLVAQVDSLSAVNAGQNQELESIYADINDVTAGMQSLREAEHLLLLEAEKETKGSPSKQQLARLKNDVQAVTEAIAGYKSQIAKLENRTKSQSAEFKRMIANLNAELDVRAAKLDELTTRLAATNKELAMKVEEVKALVRDMDALDKVSKEQRMKIAEQDQSLHTAHYCLGTRKALREANVITRQGIFCPPIVSSQAQQADFIDVDTRDFDAIELNEKKAKVLSSHPEGSYALEAGEDGKLVLKILDGQAFWQQTRYLVVMVG